MSSENPSPAAVELAGVRIFTCSFVDPVDGGRFSMSVVGRSVEDVGELVARLHADVTVDGETMAIGEITPDGPRTDWVARGQDAEDVTRRAVDELGEQ